MDHKTSSEFGELPAEQHAPLRTTQTDELCCFLGFSLWAEQPLPTTPRERLLPWLSRRPEALQQGGEMSGSAQHVAARNPPHEHQLLKDLDFSPYSLS